MKVCADPPPVAAERDMAGLLRLGRNYARPWRVRIFGISLISW